jgi:hypothetical protein
VKNHDKRRSAKGKVPLPVDAIDVIPDQIIQDIKCT